jgi:hypothetical protein
VRLSDLTNRKFARVVEQQFELEILLAIENLTSAAARFTACVLLLASKGFSIEEALEARDKFQLLRLLSGPVTTSLEFLPQIGHSQFLDLVREAAFSDPRMDAMDASCKNATEPSEQTRTEIELSRHQQHLLASVANPFYPPCTTELEKVCQARMVRTAPVEG